MFYCCIDDVLLFFFVSFSFSIFFPSNCTMLPLISPLSFHLTSPLVQFNLLHSKFHLCSVPTRALLLSAYIKFINLFPETKSTIQEVLRSDSQIRNSDVELQQRAVEYLKLSSIASTDVLVRPFAHILLICLTPFICLHNITVCNCVGHSA